MFNKIILSLAVINFCFSAISNAEISSISTEEVKAKEPVTAQLILEQESIRPGAPFMVGIQLSLKKGWHAYWKNPGDAGMAPTIQWDLPEGYSAGEIQWPTPKKFSLMGTVGFGYEGDVILLSEITPPQNAKRKADIAANISWVVCDDSSCLPGDTRLAASIPVDSEKPQSKPAERRKISDAKQTIPQLTGTRSAHHKDNLIIVTLNTKEAIEGVEFFSEDHTRIDHAIEPVFVKGHEEEGTYHIILREGIGADQAGALKGVLVLKTPEETRDISYEINLPVTPTGAPDIAMGESISPIPKSFAPEPNDGGLLFWIGGAFLGGLILNLMPCVFPVISFKVLSFVKLAGKSRSLILKHVAAFSTGVLLSFWALAATLLILKSYGHAVGWGFQLQEPLFVAAMASVMLIFGLSMFGVFEFGAGFASFAGQAQAKKKSEGLGSSLFSGILATAVATPCTGPLMAPALGFAATQPPLSSMLIFTSLGIGMASPYLFLGAFPQFLRFMPKPGNWMVIFKEAMGFVMLASVIWLVWVFAGQTDSSLSLLFLLSSFLMMAVACWIYGTWGTPVKKKRTRLISYGIASLTLLSGVYLLGMASAFPSEANTVSSRENETWVTFSPEKLAELRSQGIPVFIDFTAKWCLVCQANHMVLSSEAVDKKFEEAGIVRMKADWTSRDPIIAKELEKFGRNSVPLYLLYGKDKNETAEVLPQLLTPGTVIEYIEKI